MSDMSSIGRKLARVAILIDGDSLGSSLLPELEAHAATLGSRTIARVYGDMTLRPDWAAQRLYLATHCPSGSGNKNRADMQLVVDALDLAHRGLVDAFVIASNDRDFDPAIAYLRANGWHAERLARPETKVVEAVKAAPAKQAKPKPAPSDPFLEHVRTMVATGGPEGIAMARLGGTHATFGFKISDTPEQKWRKWLEARPAVFRCDPKGPNARVRVIG